MLIWLFLLSLSLLLLLPGIAKAEQKPVYPQVLSDDAVQQLQHQLEPVLALSDTEILRLIPDRAGIYFVGCPNCDGGAQEGQISWTIENPDEVFCKFCNLHYPNAKFPDNQILEVKNPVGEIHQYPYWEDDTGYRHFFRAKGWYLAREYFADAAYNLARLYHATQDRAYAQRSALILNRFAEVYPGYCVHHDYPFRQKIIFSGDQTFPYPVSNYRASKWDWWAYMDIPDNLILAYDLIRDSGKLDDNMVHQIENNFFHASVTFVRSIPPDFGNMDPTLLKGLIAAGRILNEPDYIHDTIDRIGKLISTGFFVDGVWQEGAISYHNQTFWGLKHLITLLDGYSDPDGYIHPGDGEHYENLDLKALFPILEKAEKIPELLCYPNGFPVPTHDTWAREQRHSPEISGPMLLPGMGHARLDRAKGPNQTQTYLHFSGGYGHQHADLLSLTLYSHGQERLSDIGYTHTRHRCWTLSTLSHNTVTVNGEDQAYGSKNDPSDGNLLLYVPGTDILQVVEASGNRAYPDATSIYRRQLLQIGLSPEQTYIVDLFRVAGGNRHEYVFVGDANNKGTLETDLPTTPYGDTLLPPGVSATLPTGESVAGDAEGHNLGYAFIRNVQQSPLSTPWSAVFISEGEPEATVQIHSLTQPEGTLFTASAPSIRRANEDDTKLDQILMPVLIHRREGKNLSTLFASLLEPRASQAFIDRTERLHLNGGGEMDIALKITSGNITDYILSTTDENRTIQTDGITFKGRVGFIRERNGKIDYMALIGGTLLEKNNQKLSGQGIHSGTVLKTLRKAAGDKIDGLEIDTPLPADPDLAGLTVIVQDGDGFSYGHTIQALHHQDGRTILELNDDPGYEITSDGGRLLFFPGRTWTGQAQFEIATVQIKKQK